MNLDHKLRGSWGIFKARFLVIVWRVHANVVELGQQLLIVVVDFAHLWVDLSVDNQAVSIIFVIL